MTNTQPTNENLTVHFKVKDFNAWRTGYNGNEKGRVSAGITNGRVFRNADDPNLKLPGEGQPNEAVVSDESFGRLVARVKEVLGERIKTVRASEMLRGSPARLSAWPSAMRTGETSARAKISSGVSPAWAAAMPPISATQP